MSYSHMSGLQLTELPLLNVTTVSTITTAGNVTYTAAQVLGGLILRNTSGASRSDQMPTASDLQAAMGDNVLGGSAGNSFEFTVRNTAGGAETITLTTNTGMTLSGVMTIAQNNSKRFLVVIAGGAGTVYSLGTVTT